VGDEGSPQLFLFIGILIFMLLRSPCKNLKPYKIPFWDFNNGGANKNIGKKERDAEKS
jgi:hypothetical protein